MRIFGFVLPTPNCYSRSQVIHSRLNRHINYWAKPVVLMFALSLIACNDSSDDGGGSNPPPTVLDDISRVSVDSAGMEVIGGNSVEPSISWDDRYVAFQSAAFNLVVGDNNLSDDIFVHDTVTATTTRVSVGSAGVEGNSNSFRPSISGDGRFVAFGSRASNLVAVDTNGSDDIFVRDTVAATTTRVSVDSAGAEGNFSSFDPSISGDDRYVAFRSTAFNLVVGDNNLSDDIFVHDTVTGATTRVSVDSAGMEGNFSSFEPSISWDGSYVAFQSTASNLVTGDTNLSDDIFRAPNQP